MEGDSLGSPNNNNIIITAIETTLFKLGILQFYILIQLNGGRTHEDMHWTSHMEYYCSYLFWTERRWERGPITRESDKKRESWGWREESSREDARGRERQKVREMEERNALREREGDENEKNKAGQEEERETTRILSTAVAP